MGVVYVEKASGRVAEIAVKVSGAIARGMNREIPCGHCEISPALADVRSRRPLMKSIEMVRRELSCSHAARN